MAYGVSVIVACFNSEKVIKQTLQFLNNQNTDITDWEVILIDNNSSDNTSKIALETWDFSINPNFRVVREEKSGLSNARIRGYKEAQYDIMSFVDDDNHVPDNWIDYQYSIFKNPEIGVLGCTSIGKFDFEVPSWYEKNKLAFATGRLYEGELIDITPEGIVYGAGMTLRRKIYTDLLTKGWNPYLSGRIGNKQTGGEDSEITLSARLLGYKIYYSNQINTRHFIQPQRLTWERLEKMTEGFGESDVFTLPYTLIYKDQTTGKNSLNTLRRKWWFNYIGKKISLVIADPFPFLRNSKNSQKDLIRIRNRAFCNFLLENRKKFENSFEEISKIMKLD